MWLTARTATLSVVLIAVLFAEQLQPSDVKIIGDIDYGQTSDPLEYSGQPRYAALVFTGKAGDQVDVTVRSADRTALVAIADGTLNQLAAGKTHLTFQLPDHGPDAEAYYIIFRDSDGKPARFTVALSRTNKQVG